MPDGLFYICGKQAYPRLLATWTGSCIKGIVHSRFFLLLNSQREQLGVPLFETLGTRIKRNLSVGGNQRWGEDECLPRGSLRPMGQPLGHKMRVGVTRLAFTCSIESLGYKWW
jgi:hypothetical protein